ncbi:universal stress protein [Halorubrum sp. CBA1125]|uniref:universal stress protein n=1 Tax=Halorubrum sp. CBA1125 TaxID=2668072 RepID=UPI0012E89266|nr:universal stress protein [Halorubrum sp. CBA1125]MUW13799.1 universal stress protein [Halorubrum sp. CBA1125]
MTILAAIDENERSKQTIEVAYDLATTYDDTMVALHVVPQEDYKEHRDSVRNIPEFSDFSLGQEMESAANFAEKFVSQTIDDLDRSRVRFVGRVGNVTDEILSIADDIEPRFLVISGQRRSPTGKAVFGNTAQQILLNADCPVVSRLTDD